MTTPGADPTVSIVIATRDRASLLPRAIESALAALAALGRPGEVIVVDDASTDGTWAHLQRATDPRVRPLNSGSRRGVAAARNLGAGAARGEWVGFLDDDDELLPGWWQLASMINEATGFVSGAAIFTREDGTQLHVGASPVPSAPDSTASLVCGSWIVRKRIFDQLGGFDEHLHYGENFELGIRLLPSVAASGLAVAWCGGPVVRVRHRDDAERRQARPEWRLASTERILHLHGEALRELPKVFAGQFRTAAVASARLRRGRDASRYFLRAARVGTDRGRDVVRAAAAVVPPARAWLWPAPKDHVSRH